MNARPAAAWLHDLATLLRLRLLLLVRRGIRRYTRNARLAAPMRSIVLLLVLAGLMFSLVAPLTTFLSMAVRGPAGRSAAIGLLSSGALAGNVIIFFYAALALVTMLTYNSDLQLLLLTPLSPRLILGEKLLTVSLSFSLAPLLTTPILIGIGSVLHAGLLYDVLVVLMVLLVPVAPASLAMLLVVAVLRWLPATRARTAVAVGGMGMSFVLYVTSQLLAQHLAGGATSFGHTSPWLGLLPFAWPGYALASAALGHGWVALAYLAGVAIFAAVLAGLAVEVSSELLTTGWATYGEVARRKRRAGERIRSGFRPPDLPGTAAAPVAAVARASGRPSTLPLIHKEWLMLRRDPQRLAQLAYPLLIIGFSLYRTLSARPSQVAERAHLTSLFTGSLYIMASFAGIIMLSFLALSIINYEGRSLYLLALTPLSPRQILLAKWTVCVAPVLVVVEGLLAVGIVALHVVAAQALLAALAQACLIVALGAGFITIGLMWPRLTWDNPRRQFSGTALFLAMAMGIAMALIMAFLVIAAFVLWNIAPWLSALPLAGILLLTGGVTGVSAVAAPRLLQNLFLSEAKV